MIRDTPAAFFPIHRVMQFRITTLMLIIGTFAVPLALTTSAGPWTQVLGMLATALAWMGVLLTNWASNLPQATTTLFGHIITLTCGIYSAFIGVLGVSLCIGQGLAAMFR